MNEPVRLQPPWMKNLMVYLAQAPQFGTVTIHYEHGQPTLLKIEHSVRLPKGAAPSS